MTKPPRQYLVDFPSAAVLNRLMQEIRFLAGQSEKVFFSPHAQKQMALRGLTDVEAINVLRLGEIKGLPWHEPDIGGARLQSGFSPAREQSDRSSDCDFGCWRPVGQNR